MFKRVLALVMVSVMLFIVGCSKSAPPAPPDGGSTGPELQELKLTLDGTKDRQAELEAMASYLRAIGVTAEVRIWEKAALTEEIKKGSRQLYSQDWGSSTFDPYDLAVPKLKTSDRGNFSFYSNPEVDRLLTEGSSGAQAPVRQKAYEQAQELLYRDAPWIFGYYMDVTEAQTADVVGFSPAMDSRINLHDVSRTGADSLVVGLRTDRLQSLDPGNHRDRETETVIRNIYDGLVTRTHDGRVVPELAESWSQPDPSTYIFKLRQGVKFHDGSTMTADDVLFSLQRNYLATGLDGAQSPRAGLMGPIKSVEKMGEHEVKVTLEKPFPVWLQLIVHTQILSKAHTEKMGTSQKLSENPIGTGPFKFVRGRVDSEIVLERFEDYYGGAADVGPVGKAPLKQATFRMIPEPATRVAALKTGEVHIIQEVPVDQIQALAGDAKVKVQSAQGTRMYMVEINTKLISDVRVRQALNHAINWDEIVKEIYGGRAHRVGTALLPSGFGYNQNIKPYAYDPEKAKALLKEAGYRTK